MSEKRPVLKLEYSVLERFMTGIAFIALILNAVLIIANWNTIPDKIATHVNGAGNIDGWGNKGTLLITPIMSIASFSLLFILSKFPHVYNYLVIITEENAEHQYRNARTLMIVINAVITSMFTYISWQTILLAKYNGTKGFGFIFAFIVVIFVPIIIYIKNSVKQN